MTDDYELKEVSSAQEERFRSEAFPLMNMLSALGVDPIGVLQNAKAYTLNTHPGLIGGGSVPEDAFIQRIKSGLMAPHSTGLKWLDDMFGGGIVDSTIMAVIGAPSTGKTTLCLQLAVAMAMMGRDVRYVSLEMDTVAMLHKAISCFAHQASINLTSDEIDKAYTDDHETEKWKSVRSFVHEYFLQINPHLQIVKKLPEGGDIHDLDSVMRYLKNEADELVKAGQKAPVVVMDYLQLLNAVGAADEKDIVKRADIALRHYVEDYNAIAIVIYASNRDSNKSGVVSLYSGRDSSVIEYGADYVLTINFQELTTKGSTADITELKKRNPRDMLLRLEKNRHGALEDSRLWYYPAYNYFTEWKKLNEVPAMFRSEKK